MKNLEFDPFNSYNFLGLNDHSDPDVNLFDRNKFIKINYFDTEGAVKQT